MSRSLPSTPSRRSQRFQPTATPTPKGVDQNILECNWASKPIYVRKAAPDIDLLSEEQEEKSDKLEEETSGNEEDDDDMETVFYDAFRMKRKATAFRGAKSMRHGKTETLTYRIGDTVMVETDTLYIMKRPPSIGVIVAMWETRRKGVSTSNSTDPSKMRIRIHWFLRPTELATIRAKREHEGNEIYYSLSTRVIVTPGVILSRCLVSSNTNKHAARNGVSATLSKRKSESLATGSPLKKCAKLSPVSSDDSEDSESEAQGKAEQRIQDPEKIFYCKFAIDSRRGIFYNFKWERHQLTALAKSTALSHEAGSSSSKKDDTRWGDGRHWDVEEDKMGPPMQKSKKSQREEKVSESDVDSSDNYQEGDDGDSSTDLDMEKDEVETSVLGRNSEDGDFLDSLADPHTPSKKRKRGKDSATTPHKSKRNKTLVQPTPHSKAALKRRKHNSATTSSPRKRKSLASFPVRYTQQSLGFQLSLSHLPKDPWLRSMHALHVGSRPDALPCREEEYAKVLRSVGELLEEGSGGCIYISGVPGTGKTATVHTIIRELKRMAENNEINPFTYVEINGLKIPEPAAAYNLLWEGISGHNVSTDGHLRINSKDSLKALTQYFTTGNRGPEGHACVVLMDELDQLVTPKQDVIYNFFNWPTLVESKLVVIAVANTMDLPERVMTGRVRSRLGMVRINFQPYTREQLEKIVEARLASAKEGLEEEEGASKVIIAPDAIKLASMTVSRITGDARRVLDICRRAIELIQGPRGTVKPPHVKEVVQMMQNSPTAAYLRDLSLHERLMLTSLIKCIKREGVEEIKWSEVEHQHLTYVNVLTSEEESRRKPTNAELRMVLDSLVASRAVVLEDGPTVARKPEAERRLLLNIEQGEVERVLGDIGGPRWKNVLSN